MTGSRSRRRRLLLWAVRLVVCLAVLELGAWAACRILAARAPFLVYRPPAEVPLEAYRAWREARDPLLGWPSPEARGRILDEAGSRPVPAFPRPGGECVSLYGDSFTHGSEVSDEEAWGNRLAERLGCRVANYAVGGYGTDQAYLRFLSAEDEAPVAVLGIHPDDVLRNVNRYRHFLTGRNPFGFKPRFLLEGSRLRLLPPPDPGPEQLEDLLADPDLQQEAFLPGRRPGPVLLDFPATLALVETLGRDRVVAVLRGRPSWEPYLRLGHPTGSLEVTLAVAEAFAERGRAQGARLLVLVFPTPSSSRIVRRGDDAPTAPLVRALRERGIRTLDLHGPLLEALAGEELCTVLTEPEACRGHFDARGNALIARMVGDHLLGEGLLPRTEGGEGPRARGRRPVRLGSAVRANRLESAFSEQMPPFSPEGRASGTPVARRKGEDGVDRGVLMRRWSQKD